MSNYFEIRTDLLNIVRQLEEGEVTDELQEELRITEKDLEIKLKSYAKAVRMIEGEITIIKDEKDRLDKHIKSKELTINKLKNVIKDAVNLFGYNGKSGNKKLDYEDIKFYTRIGEELIIPDNFESTDYLNEIISINIPKRVERELLAYLQRIENETINKAIEEAKVVYKANKDKIKEDLDRLERYSDLAAVYNQKIKDGGILTSEEAELLDTYDNISKLLEGCTIVSKDTVIFK